MVVQLVTNPQSEPLFFNLQWSHSTEPPPPHPASGVTGRTPVLKQGGERHGFRAGYRYYS